MATTYVPGVGYVADEIVVSAPNFSVSSFRGSFKSGLAKPTFFTFNLADKPKMLSDNFDVKLLSMRVKRAQVPDMSIQTYQHSYNGVPIKYPWENSTSDITLEIICSTDMSEHMFFSNWINNIIDYKSTDQTNSTYTVRYRDDYAVEAKLVLYDTQQNKKTGYVFDRMWPIQMNQVEVDWSSKDQIMTFEVTMSYSYWSIKSY